MTYLLVRWGDFKKWVDDFEMGWVGTPSRTMIIVNLDIVAYHVLFRHIQPYCGIFRTLCNSCIFRTLSYSKFQHIQNPRYIQNSVKAYSGIFRMLCNASMLRALPYSEFWHMQHPRHIHNPVCISTFRHIQAYSVIIVIITLTFFFLL